MRPEIRILHTEILSKNWYVLKKLTYEYKRKDGSIQVHHREAYDRGNGATILLYHRVQKSVILTRQFRLPTFINGNPDGMLIEACAGLLDKDNPEACIIRETEEETGFRLHSVQKVFESYMSPGSVTEILHFFISEYDQTMKVQAGGGVEKEQEEIEVMEIPYEKALAMVDGGEIKDGKTIMLLQYLRVKNIL